MSCFLPPPPDPDLQLAAWLALGLLAFALLALVSAFL